MARLMVLGRSGQLATALDAALRSDGHTVELRGRAEGDLGDPDRTAAHILKMVPDGVVNAAAYTDVDRAEGDEAAAWAVNVDGAEAAARAAARLGVPFVHFSTDYVFDGLKGAPYVENDPPAPLGVYGASKLAGEAAVLAANARSVILRTSWLFSGHGRNFLTTMIRLSEEDGPLGIVNDQIGQPTSAPSLAIATAAILRRLQAGSGPELFGKFHAAGAEPVTWCGFAQGIMENLASHGRPSRTVTAIATSDYPTRVRRPVDSRLDCSRLDRVYGLRLPGWRLALEAEMNDYIRKESMGATA